VREVIFYAGKTHNFEGFSDGAKTFFDPQIVLSAAKGNFGVKKVGAPSKNPEKLPIMYFASIPKVTLQTIRISSAMVFLCTGVTICPHFFSFYCCLSFWC
jgi:hypothetical protein